MNAKPRIVIIGGGFGGLYAAKALKRAKADVALIDKRNFHLFQPLLYQVATGGLSPGDIASPLRAVLKRHKNIKTLMGEVIDIDPINRRVILQDEEIEYDFLIVAAGVKHSYFGHDQWEASAPGLKTIEDATEIRRRIFLAFEAAERETDPEKRRAWLNTVIVGGGPTGVELAGALGELARFTLKNDFRSIDPTQARILLVEGGARVLPSYPESLSAQAKCDLERHGVTVRVNTIVTDIDPQAVILRTGETSECIPARTTLWAAGVQASPLAKILADKAGAQLDRIGRVIVEPDLSLKGHPEILIIGDLAHFEQDGQALPGVAPVAMQQGRYAAKAVRKKIQGETMAPFRYFDKGSLAVIGRSSAVANIKGLRVSGFMAWLLWLFVHIMYLVEYDNRLIVFFQWAYNYFTRNRGARLITHQESLVLKESGESKRNPPPA
ncbi:MAG: NAD(P)/FAD-dependent oxidoreductase [Candidatus Omnitrophota bacterium]